MSTNTPASPETDKNLAESVADRLERRERELAAQRESENRSKIDSAWDAYLRVLLGTSPTEEEFDAFVDACALLKIEKSLLEDHQRFVVKSREAEAAWNEHCRLKRDLPAKQSALAELRQQFAPQLKQLRDAENEVSSLENQIRGTQQAAGILKSRAEKYPNLFDMEASPPRLKRPTQGGNSATA